MARNILECKECGSRYDVTRRQPGSRVRCKKCQSILKIPKKDKRASKTRRIQVSARMSRRQEMMKEFEELKVEAEELAKEASDPMNLRVGEMVENLEFAERKVPVFSTPIIKSFIDMVKQSWGRLIGLSALVMVLGALVSLVFLIFAIVVFKNDIRGQHIFLGLTGLLSSVSVLIIQGAGMRLGSRILKGEDLYAANPSWKRAFTDILGDLKWAVKVCPKLFALEALFYLFILLSCVVVYFLAGLASIVALAVAPIFLASLVVAYLVFNLAMFGVSVEERPVFFSVKRAWLLFKSAYSPVLLALILFAILSGVIVTVYQVLAIIVMGGQLAGITAFFLGRELLGFFVTAIHCELTKEEGKEVSAVEQS